MEQFFKLIEQGVYNCGYHTKVSGADIYNEICDQIEGKENGTYLFLVKKDGDTVFEYNIDILDEEFNLSYIRITCNGTTYQADFDEA